MPLDLGGLFKDTGKDLESNIENIEVKQQSGGGIAANLARVLPRGSWVDVDRSTWSPSPVFRVLADLGGLDLAATEGTWNLGIGFLAAPEPVIAALAHRVSLTDGMGNTVTDGNVANKSS